MSGEFRDFFDIKKVLFEINQKWLQTIIAKLVIK